jgi:ribosomal protein L29
MKGEKKEMARLRTEQLVLGFFASPHLARQVKRGEAR